MTLNFVDGTLELKLDLLDFLWLLLLLCLKVEVVDVLGVKRLDPLGNDQALLQQLHFFILALIRALVAPNV